MDRFAEKISHYAIITSVLRGAGVTGTNSCVHTMSTSPTRTYEILRTPATQECIETLISKQVIYMGRRNQKWNWKVWPCSKCLKANKMAIASTKLTEILKCPSTAGPPPSTSSRRPKRPWNRWPRRKNKNPIRRPGEDSVPVSWQSTSQFSSVPSGGKSTKTNSKPSCWNTRMK